mmetsp:Transcript_3002/g.6629  ORF Transcript_3002/g.6629 Transcript_3002/m.6629 type:complete len:210 (+) Transcript_3002:282-911(+)
MCDIRPLHTETSWSDESFVLGCLSSKVVTDKCTLCHHSFPCLILLGTRSHNFEHFIICHRLDLWNGHFPLSSLLLPLLLDSITQHLCPTHALPIQQIRGHSSIRYGIIIRMLITPLIMLSNRLSHRGLFFEPALIVQFGTQSVYFLGEFGSFVSGTGLTFAFAFLGVEATAMEFAMAFHVLVLRHGCGLLWDLRWRSQMRRELLFGCKV